MQYQNKKKKGGVRGLSKGETASSKVKPLAYGERVSICINADCMLRKGAGGCFGFEGCPGFRSR